MNWEAIGAIGQMLGSVAVLVTLIYLAAQIRHNTTAVQAATFQNIVALSVTFGDEVAKDPELRRVMRSGLSMEPESEPDRSAFHYIFLSLLRRYENMHYQSKLGLLPDEQWEGLRHSLARYVHKPGFRSWRHRNADLFNADFHTFLDELETLSVGDHFS